MGANAAKVAANVFWGKCDAKNMKKYSPNNLYLYLDTMGSAYILKTLFSLKSKMAAETAGSDTILSWGPQNSWKL